MRTRLLTVLLTALTIGVAPAALAQDEIDPEGGELGEGDAELGGEGEGEMSSDDAGDIAPASDDGAAKPISVGLLLGYGISLEDGPNPWGLGFGLRGGYNLDAIYLGARFVYYLGESEEMMIPFAGTVELTLNIWELGIEGGYDVDAGGVVIRPGLGLGIASINLDAPGGSDSSTELYIAPGVSALFDVAENIFIGAEARFKIVFAEETAKGIILLANGGMRF